MWREEAKMQWWMHIDTNRIYQICDEKRGVGTS